jgi:hypothetical protein
VLLEPHARQPERRSVCSRGQPESSRCACAAGSAWQAVRSSSVSSAQSRVGLHSSLEYAMLSERSDDERTSGEWSCSVHVKWRVRSRVQCSWGEVSCSHSIQCTSHNEADSSRGATSRCLSSRSERNCGQARASTAIEASVSPSVRYSRSECSVEHPLSISHQRDHAIAAAAATAAAVAPPPSPVTVGFAAPAVVASSSSSAAAAVAAAVAAPLPS